MPEIAYDHNQIELKWADRWKGAELYRADPASSAPKYYVVEMLPYPSGRLHMGHVRNYAIGDALARFMWMRGYNVQHPMGWDAFGLPAENAAIKSGVPPREWTFSRIAEMKRQMHRMAFSYDWSREITTCEPEYYRWNQWFFLKMMERGLAYRKKALVNWCPECGTVLANEQVVDGCCWRHESTPVVQRALEQWFWKITAYAEELLKAIDEELEGAWPDRVLAMQRNWIGRSAGAEVDFKLEKRRAKPGARVYDSHRYDLRRNGDYSGAGASGCGEIAGRGGDGAGQGNDRRAGAAGAGRHRQRRVVHGRVRDQSVQWGEAAGVDRQFRADGLRHRRDRMAVPAHDERDFRRFAKRKYGLPIFPVIRELNGALNENPAAPLTDDGVLERSGEYSGLASDDARQAVSERAERDGFGKATITYRLKDWGISRQRYWGTPDPGDSLLRNAAWFRYRRAICRWCLPTDVKITGVGHSPLEDVPSFVNVKCPKCGESARRETDTMDTFVDSSWYFYRYCDPHNDRAPFDRAKVDRSGFRWINTSAG